MKHDPITPPPSAGANGPRWTNRKMVEFLRALAATHSVTDAARAVGMSRQSAYKLRSRLKGKAFDALSAADSAPLSPLSDAQLMAQIRRFRGKSGG